MDVLRTGCSMLGTLESEGDFSRQLDVADRLIAVFPAMLLYWHHYATRRIRIATSSTERGVAAHFLHLLHGKRPSELHERAMDASLILYAEHEFNASTFTARVCAATLSDFYSAVTGAIGTLRGPLHGGANEAAMQLIERFDSPAEATHAVKAMLARKEKIMGFGHAVYRTSDPAQRRDQELVETARGGRPQYGAVSRVGSDRDAALAGKEALCEPRLLQRIRISLHGDSDAAVHADLRLRAHRRLGRAHHRAARQQSTDSSDRRLRRRRAARLRPYRRASLSAVPADDSNRSFANVYAASLDDPESFWAAAAQSIVWSKPWDRVLDGSRAPFYRWFTGGELNTCYNAVDRHVEEGRGRQTALIYDSPVTDQAARYTFAELRAETARLAGALQALGVGRGDTVVIYMPMVPQAVFAMLACARLGAIHSVVFGGFAANELAARIDDCKPKVVLSASCGIEVGRIVEYKPLLDKALDLARHKPSRCVILQRPQRLAALDPARDLDWDACIAAAVAAPCIPVAATDPLYILYTSGTTGRPKGVVRDNGGHAVALLWSMRNIYGLRPGDTFWTASDIGWVVGHSYIVYGPLLNGTTTVLYEGKPVGTPDAGAFWRVVEEHGVNVLFTAPTALRAIKREDPEAARVVHYDLRSLRTLVSRRRTHRSAHLALGAGELGSSGRRSLVANGNRLGDLRELPRHREVADP